MKFPPHANRMHRYDPSMTAMVMNYLRERSELAETPIDGIGDRAMITKALDGLISSEPKDPREVFAVYVDVLSGTVISADSPRNFAFIPSAPTEASMMFDMVVSSASLQACSWLEAAGAVAAEDQALAVLADLAGLPAGSGGVFVSGGSAANLSALVVARDKARGDRTARGLPEARLRVVVSDQAHSSVASTLNLIGVDALVVPTADGRLDGSALDSALAGQDLGEVIAIVATAGTTNAGIIDDLQAVATRAREHDWWFHVDAAYGGAGMLSPRIRHLYAGIEHADSIVMDPHKWWFAPYDCGALLYRDPRLAQAVHTQHASYLDVIHGDDVELNPSDLAYHLTRRARGLPLWFSLAVNGLDAYRDAVEHGLAIAQFAADRIRAQSHLELIREPVLSVVLFRRTGWTKADYEAWGDRLLQSQIAFVTPSSWRGESVARLVFLHPSTTPEMVDEVLGTMA
ncbi:MAG: pyridoxal phosphate-dependent decarboxylase family protein [Actinomycetales bacterium]